MAFPLLSALILAALSSAAPAGGSKSACERSLYSAQNRSELAAYRVHRDPVLAFDGWARRTEALLGAPVRNGGENEEELRFKLILREGGRYRSVLKKLLRQNGFVARELRDEEGFAGFELSPEDLVRLRARMGGLSIPHGYRAVVHPAFNLAHGAVASFVAETKSIFFPEQILKGPLRDEDALALAHELVHVRIDQLRDQGQKTFVTRFLPGDQLRKAFKDFPFYSDNFTPEEIVAFLVTALIRLDRVCAGVGEGAPFDSAMKELWASFAMAKAYSGAVLPGVIAALERKDGILGSGLDPHHDYLFFDSFDGKVVWPKNLRAGQSTGAFLSELKATYKSDRLYFAELTKALQKIFVNPPANTDWTICAEIPKLDSLLQKLQIHRSDVLPEPFFIKPLPEPKKANTSEEES